MESFQPSSTPVGLMLHVLMDCVQGGRIVNVPQSTTRNNLEHMAMISVLWGLLILIKCKTATMHFAEQGQTNARAT